MHRRSLFKGMAATATGGALASLALPAASASASTIGSYDVAVCEQAKSQILIHPAAGPWTAANCRWSWTAPTDTVRGFNTWQNLSDVKFRDTTAHGWVALTTASYGRVGIVDIGDTDALLWSATP
ncbi:hypothetical protein KCMC57_up01590 [Kitasatospora sp. CMC57]|uniref:Uncharacterized protein n=1 Tax=Kitasatospora sp. CMC57 TaxID=3231513 RepID=A0AB33JR70_9ACTN